MAKPPTPDPDVDIAEARARLRWAGLRAEALRRDRLPGSGGPEALRRAQAHELAKLSAELAELAALEALAQLPEHEPEHEHEP